MTLDKRLAKKEPVLVWKPNNFYRHFRLQRSTKEELTQIKAKQKLRKQTQRQVATKNGAGTKGRGSKSGGRKRLRPNSEESDSDDAMKK